MVGEELLVHDFLQSGERGDSQMKMVMDLYQRDRERKSQNANHSQSNIGRSSPYQGPDGRPPIRPITPLKSSQTTRVSHSIINST
jgi:hypothetical protein